MEIYIIFWNVTTHDVGDVSKASRQKDGRHRDTHPISTFEYVVLTKFESFEKRKQINKDCLLTNLNN